MAIGEYRTNVHTKTGCLYYMIDELCELRAYMLHVIDDVCHEIQMEKGRNDSRWNC